MPSYSKEEQDNAHYTRVLLAICIPVVVLAIALPLLWNLSQRGGEAAPSEDCVLSAEDITSLATAAGYEPTGDEVTSILLSVTSDENLSSVNIVVLNTTQQFAKLLEIDPAAQVDVDGVTQSLTSYYDDSGTAGIAAAIARAGIISIDHAVEMDGDSWSVFLEAVNQGSSDISVDLDRLLEGIKANDMSVRTLRGAFTQATKYGFSAASIVQIPTVQATDGTGNLYLKLSETQIGLEAGTIR